MLFLYRGHIDIPLPDPPVYPVHYPSFLYPEDDKPLRIKLPSLHKSVIRQSIPKQIVDSVVDSPHYFSSHSSFESSSSSSHQVSRQQSVSGVSKQSSVSSLSSSVISVPSISLSQKEDNEAPVLRVFFHDKGSVVSFPLPWTSNLEVQTQYDNQSYLLVTFEVVRDSICTYELLVKSIPPAKAGERFITISIKVDDDVCDIKGVVDGCDDVWKAVSTSTLMSV